MCWIGDNTAIGKIAERDFYVYKIGKIVWNNIFISDIRGYNYASKCLNRIVPLVVYSLFGGNYIIDSLNIPSGKIINGDGLLNTILIIFLQVFF